MLDCLLKWTLTYKQKHIHLCHIKINSIAFLELKSSKIKTIRSMRVNLVYGREEWVGGKGGGESADTRNFDKFDKC